MLPLESFKQYIRQNELFSAGHKILLAVSGGKDSILMAHLFKASGFDFGMAHCNFGLRGTESQRDEHFVRTLAAVLEVPCYVTHFETKAYAAEHSISTQMAARDLRYLWFEELRIAHQFDRIAVAHHQDDAVETVLLNLVRGTGIAGLHGILPKRGNLIRPLLFLSRAEIEELITAGSIDFVEDSSNLSSTYARNKIRLEVIPKLREINPNLDETFAQNIRRFTETEMVLQDKIAAVRQELCQQKGDTVYLAIDKIKQLQPANLLLSELLKDYHFTTAVTEEVLHSLDKQSGTSFYSATHRLTINREQVLITAISAQADGFSVIHPSDSSVNLHGQRLEINISDSVGFENNASKAFVDHEQLIFPLIVRTWQAGDRFMPLGMKTFKKLSDFFIDQKVPLPEKEKVPVLINGNGEVIWIVGLRQDNRYKVTATTKKVAIFEQKFI